jgi:hypothetical protein
LAGFVDSTVKDIDARLSELRAEVTKLEAARSALTGSGRARARSTESRNGTSTRRRSSRGPGRPRGRRGGNTRAAQALDLVRTQPGITIPQIAQAMSIEPNYLYRVLPKLVNEGKVRREGQGWLPVE